jgi:transcriptional regulator with PAS, ATPase and Fis domain
VAPTGCGKEVLAREVHRASGRTGPFVAQNCAALPESLIEAQLFGYVKGAFTGATAASPGLFVEADGGTLLLDEITDLPLPQQAKLLRVLEERAVVPLGATRPRPVDVRFLAASQVALRERVDQGAFRGDLLARLAGATLAIPSLSERREEAPRLFASFFAEAGGDPSRIQTTLVEKLCLFDWPFNVRQLRLLADSMVALYPSEPLGTVELDETLRKNVGLGGVLTRERKREAPAVLVSAEQKLENAELLGRRRAAWLARNGDEARRLEAALRRHSGNVSSAAREAGISRQRAQRLLAAIRGSQSK